MKAFRSVCRWVQGFSLLVIMTTLADRANAEWREVFSDPGVTNWEAKWFLDGALSTVTNTPEGLVITSGPIADKDASHAVLWTHESFAGDIRIEYDFTRLDSNLQHTSVCLLYVQATGTGRGPFAADIWQWRDRRTEPKMSLYFNNMHLYHVSYACTGGKDFHYVRARRYPTKGNFVTDTAIAPSYDNVDLFHPGETWHLVFEKVGTSLSFSASRGDECHVWTWDAAAFPPITGGRIGFRQMLGRQSRYANIRIFLAEPDGPGRKGTDLLKRPSDPDSD